MSSHHSNISQSKKRLTRTALILASMIKVQISRIWQKLDQSSADVHIVGLCYLVTIERMVSVVMHRFLNDRTHDLPNDSYKNSCAMVSFHTFVGGTMATKNLRSSPTMPWTDQKSTIRGRNPTQTGARLDRRESVWTMVQWSAKHVVYMAAF